jgi:predicted transposase YbfD/YdcC
MGYQKDIAQAIIDKEADYILVLKGNPRFITPASTTKL